MLQRENVKRIMARFRNQAAASAFETWRNCRTQPAVACELCCVF